MQYLIDVIFGEINRICLRGYNNFLSGMITKLVTIRWGGLLYMLPTIP
jgi:hypothetical protein